MSATISDQMSLPAEPARRGPSGLGRLIASWVLALLAAAGCFGAFYSAFTPYVGTILSLTGPLLSSIGLMYGFSARRRAKRAGVGTGWASSAVLVHLGTLPVALLVLLACGLLNVLVTMTYEALMSAPGAFVEGLLLLLTTLWHGTVDFITNFRITPTF